MKRLIIKTIMVFVSISIIVLVLQFLCYYIILTKQSQTQPADLIAVFSGDGGRIARGYALANRGIAHYLTISPSSNERLIHYDKTLRHSSKYQYLIESRAETTFQNAILVSKLVRQHHIESVVLVTSDYHMPRSYFLLRLQLLDQNVKIIPNPVEIKKFSLNPLSWTRTQKKRVYNEMIEFWGSLTEMVHFKLSKHLPEKGLKRNKFIASLRSVLLFDIQHN